MVSVDEPEPPALKLTVLGIMEATGPAGVTDVERLIVPAKPAILLSIMDEVPGLPA